MTASPDLATPAARPTIRGHIAIMRIDHWVKQVFVLPGILAALSDGTSDIPSGVVVRVGGVGVGVGVPHLLRQLRDQRSARAPSDLFHQVKRYRPVPSEHCDIDDPAVAAAYRKSLSYYSLE